MMSFGPMGGGAGGNSSSTTSNLSALAPPFTVDRLNPNPNTNPNMHYTNPHYSVEPYSHTWKYAAPSAPGPELVINSTGISSVPLSRDYQFSAPASISPTSTHWSYGGDAKPYHAPYVPPVVGGGGDSLFVEGEGSRYNARPTSGLNLASQIDLFDLECGPRWMDPLEYDDGEKPAKTLDWDRSFLHEKANVGGLYSYKNQLNQGVPDSENGIISKDQISDREVHKGSLNFTHTEDKVCLEQIGFFPYDSNKPHIPASSSTYPETHPSVHSSELLKNFGNFQDLCTPYDKCVRPVDPPFSPLPILRPFPTVVIRPPPVRNVNSGRNVVSHNSHVSVGGAHNVDFEHSYPSKRKVSGIKLNSEITQGSYDADLFNFSEQGNGLFSSAPLKEHSNKSKGKFGSQLPDANVSSCFTMGCDNNVQVVSSAEDSSDFVDLEDSPCWKGATPSSRFPKLDVESCNSNLAKKNADEYYGFDHQRHQDNLHSIVESSGVFFEKIGQENKNGEIESSTLDRSLDSICSSKEQSLVGVGMTLNDVSEGGAVAVHAAEKVLDSPASQEDAIEHSKILNPNFSMPTMIKALHNLSELLLFHLSNDACSLEEENSEIVKQTISNLDSCLSRRTMPASCNQESKSPEGAEKLGESFNVGTTSVGPITDKSVFSGKKDEKLPYFSPLRDELDITNDDDMAKAIKKVLEDNFHHNEAMHSEARLFKSLWLDAEAKLCSISYKARFDRMKIQMEEIKNSAPPQENEGIAEMMSKFGISASELTPQTHDGPIPKPVLRNISNDDNEASVMARFHILKSRKDIAKSTAVIEEEDQPEMIDGDHAASIMARFNILKSRDESSKLDGLEVEKQLEMIDSETACDNYPMRKSLDETLSEAIKPRYLHREMFYKFESDGDDKYEPVIEFHNSVSKDPVVSQPLENTQNNQGLRDSSSSSDWEHVQKEDICWKNV